MCFKILLTSFLLFFVCHSLKSNSPGNYITIPEPEFKRYDYSSFYITMPDSVKIAVDLFLPRALPEGQKIPLIMHYTRYTRSLRLKWPFRWIINPFMPPGFEEEIAFFVRHGYAFMNVDVRGSGASFGYRKMEFSREEIQDGYHIAEWIVDQPWSNGKIGTTGVSYPGTTAELLLTTGHPAYKAAFCRNSIFDLYDDITFPGGLRHSPFVEVWGDFTLKLDLNDFSPFGRRATRFVRSVNRVDGDRRGRKLAKAFEEHSQNVDIFSELINSTYRDHRTSFDSSLYIDQFSVHSYTDEIETSGAAIYRLSGFYDGALANSAVKGFLSMNNPQKMILGPWRHGSQNNKSPHRESMEMGFNIKEEVLRFFDFHLKGIDNGIMDEPRIYYYTLAEEKWKWANQWPPENTKYVDWYFHNDNRIVNGRLDFEQETTQYAIDYSATTGLGSRWNSLTELYMYEPTGYPERELESKKLLNFNSAPLSKDIIVTGHVIVDMFLSVDNTDGNVLIYLEDVEPGGTVHYVTEGQLRLIHRKTHKAENFTFQKIGPYRTFNSDDSQPMVPGVIDFVSIDLQPVSYLFREGHQIRISIAGADADHFDYPENKPEILTLYKGQRYPSRILLPVEF